MSIDDLVEEIEQEETKTKEASASEEKSVDEFSEKVVERAMEKIAERRDGRPDKSKKDTGTLPKAELSPQEMVEKVSEEVSDERVEEINERLSDRQKEKVATIKGVFEDDTKANLFEKVASYQLATNPKIVVDNNFQQYETLDGQEVKPEMFFDVEGDEDVNNFFRS